MISNASRRSPFLLLALIANFPSGTLPQTSTFNPEGVVVTIEGMGYNDNVLFMCYGGKGQTSVPYSGTSQLPPWIYPNVEALVSMIDSIDGVGCYKRLVTDPSDWFFFMGDCTLGGDSVVTYCRGPLPDGIAFQCGQYDTIIGTSSRLPPSGPTPNCHEYDRYWYCPRPGYTRLNRYWMQTPFGFDTGFVDGGCSPGLGGIECSDDDLGLFMLVHGGNIFDLIGGGDFCDNSEFLIDQECPVDRNYPRTVGCIDRRRDLSTPNIDTSDPWDNELYQKKHRSWVNNSNFKLQDLVAKTVDHNFRNNTFVTNDTLDDAQFGSNLVLQESTKESVASSSSILSLKWILFATMILLARLSNMDA